MGIVKAIANSTKDVLKDQWKEMIWCDAFAADELIKRGQKQCAEGSANKGSEDIISNGSLIVCGEAQAAIVLENGRIAGVYEEAGNNVFNSKRSASIFSGDDIGSLASNVWERVGFGGEVPIVHRVLYVSTREIMNQTFSSEGAFPIRISHDELKLDIDLKISISGMYSFKISDPVKFYKSVSGNIEGSFYVSKITSQMESEAFTFVRDSISTELKQEGLRPYELPAYVDTIAGSLKESLTEKWQELRGISVVSMAIDSLSVISGDMAIVKTLEKAAVLTNPEMAAAHITAAKAEVMTMAARNNNAMLAMAAVGVMNGAANAESEEIAESEKIAEAELKPWFCTECGTKNTKKFCVNCGNKKYESKNKS